MLKITGPSAGLSRALSASAAAAAYVLYIATIPAANLLITHVGAAGVGFGLTAPAAVFTAGLALVLRDLVRDRPLPASCRAACVVRCARTGRS
ncbi:hypothetical protein ACWDCO_17355 [Streptomyces albogriseolus]